MIVLPNSHCITYTFLFWKFGRAHFLNVEVEGLTCCCLLRFGLVPVNRATPAGLAGQWLEPGAQPTWPGGAPLVLALDAALGDNETSAGLAAAVLLQLAHTVPGLRALLLLTSLLSRSLLPGPSPTLPPERRSGSGRRRACAEAAERPEEAGEL